LPDGTFNIHHVIIKSMFRCNCNRIIMI